MPENPRFKPGTPKLFPKSNTHNATSLPLAILNTPHPPPKTITQIVPSPVKDAQIKCYLLCEDLPGSLGYLTHLPGTPAPPSAFHVCKTQGLGVELAESNAPCRFPNSMECRVWYT